MDAVPYEIRPEDIDEVITAHEPDWSDAQRRDAHAHVMRQVLEINEIVRTAAEQPRFVARGDAREDVRAGTVGDRPGDDSPDRRDLALAAIEDVLIRDGFLKGPAST